MQFISTRNKNYSISPAQAVILGISPDGGLLVPESYPDVTGRLDEWSKLDYIKLCEQVLSCYFTDYSKEELRNYSESAYKNTFPECVVPVRNIHDSVYLLELWHGPTLAFKDMALQMLPYLLNGAVKKNRETHTLLILVATSGDTGKAALEGFADTTGTAIAVFYPNNGVSLAQKLQMVTQRGDNVLVCAVEGNFDDAQTSVKEIFADKEFNETANRMGYKLSSANSINIGRLIPQIAYYFWGYFKILESGIIKSGDPINITVPTGNFGNILAAYYAKRMGLPVKKLICASNANNVLTDFFQSGEYDSNRKFVRTMSPSMDILVSSNLERLLFEISGRDDATVSLWMKNLKENGYYDIKGLPVALKDEFYAANCSEQETAWEINSIFRKYGYLMDTHTAVAHYVYEKYQKESGDSTTNLIASTASPYKFSADVLKAITGKIESDEFQCANELAAIAGQQVPSQIASLPYEKILHEDSCEKEKMKKRILNFLENR